MTPKRRAAKKRVTTRNPLTTRNPVTHRVGTGGGSEAQAVHLKAKPPSEHQTVADRLDYLCEQEGASYEITANPEKGTRTIVLVYEDGTKIGGTGENTRAAFAKLEKRVRAFKKLEAEDADDA